MNSALDYLRDTIAAGTTDKHQKISVWEIQPSPENQFLYRERTTEDGDFAHLVESIREKGVQAPLLISLDSFIVSGHQRRAAAIEADVDTVPYLLLNLRRSDHTADSWLAILREHNTGREKSFDELVKEKLVDIDPQDAARNLEADRIERTRSRIPTVELGARKVKRFAISDEKHAFADKVIEVLDGLEDYLPVSLRAIHYRLLNFQFLRNLNTKRYGELWYGNDTDSYKDLSDILTRLRLSGEVPFESICDETRPTTAWKVFRNGAEYVEDELRHFLRNFNSDLLQSQTQHFHIVVEKLTVENFVKSVAMRYTIPVTIIRGNSGITARWEIAERYKASGKDGLMLICLGDADPDGDNIVESTIRSLRDEFAIEENVRGVRVAITHQQADALRLPKDLEAKTSSPSYKAFVKKHNRTDCYELDATDPQVLQGWTDTAIRAVIDVQAFNYECAREAQEAAEIQARREAIMEIIRNGK